MSLASLADAALYGHPNPAAAGASSLTAYSDAELKAFGVLGGAGMGHPLASSSLPARGIMPTSQLPGPGRHLQILDHVVHRIDNVAKPNGDTEQEMVVSNLRHFTLKIGVLDPRCGIGRDAELPLRAELLYENGQLVEQLATCEPLLVGKTEVVALQGNAQFKLRITSLSSHRDKQRFRIRVSPPTPTCCCASRPLRRHDADEMRDEARPPIAKAESGADGGAEAEGRAAAATATTTARAASGSAARRPPRSSSRCSPRRASSSRSCRRRTRRRAPRTTHTRVPRLPAHGPPSPARPVVSRTLTRRAILSQILEQLAKLRASWWTWRRRRARRQVVVRVLAPAWLSSAPCPSEGAPVLSDVCRGGRLAFALHS